MAFPSVTPGVLGDDSLDSFDALIVGSGAGGSAVAWVLAQAGWKVLILEAGGNYFPGLDHPGRLPWPLFSNDEIKMSVRRMIWQDPVVEPRTFRRSETERARPNEDVNVLTRNVGGAAVISSVSYPRFTAVDFRMATALREAGRDFPGTGFADWPFTYEELEPFYAEAERLSGVAGTSEGPESDPFASPRSGPYPLPPQPPMYASRVLAHGASRLGLHPFNYPSAINTAPYDGRVPCVSCGFCSGYGCPRNAKGSPAVTTLRRALRTGNCQLRFECHAARLLMDGSRRRVTGVEYFDPQGHRRTARADCVILAASAIESVRLCLLSDPDGPGLGNRTDHLGRHMMFHFQTTAAGFFRQRFHGDRGRSVTHGISDFRGIEPGGAALRPDAPLGGVVEFGTSSEPIIAARSALQSLPIGRAFGIALKDILVESPFSAHIGVLIMQGEDAPQPSNRVDLDPEVRDVFGLPVPRLTYRNHDFELRAAEYYRPRMLAILEAAGAEAGLFEPADPSVPPRSRHVMGGLRMGTDPQMSVCRPDGRFHDIENLFCADGGLFPTGSGYNPTLTIIAVALRVGHLLAGTGPEPEA